MIPPARLRLATRGSALALAQAGLAADALRRLGCGDIEMVVLRTEGDRRADVPADAMPGQGWFTGELESALLDGRADCAVHSAKDLPSTLGEGLAVVAHLERGDPRDALVLRRGVPGALDDVPVGATVGTGSPRRAAFLTAVRGDLRPVPIRGNVDTRLRKLDAGEVDALLLACAGLDRLGLGDRAGVRLDPREFVPAPAQGAVALETAAGEAARLVAPADDAPTTAAVRAERSVLDAMGGGCRLPLGAWARAEAGRLVLVAALALDDGSVRRVEIDGDAADPTRLGRRAAAALRG